MKNIFLLLLLTCSGCSYQFAVITDPPEANIVFDGKYLGKSPCYGVEGFKMPWHVYTIEATKSGYFPGIKSFPNAMRAIPDKVFIQMQEQSPQYSKNQISTQSLKIERYNFDSQKNRGTITIDIAQQGIEARHWIVENIGKICSDKNITMVAGQETHREGRYRVLDESVKNGLLTITFEAVY